MLDFATYSIDRGRNLLGPAERSPIARWITYPAILVSANPLLIELGIPSFAFFPSSGRSLASV